MQSTLKLYMRILFIGDLVGTHVVVQYSCRWQGLSNATPCAFESRISSAYTIHFLIDSESTTTTANRRVRPQMKIFCDWKAWEHSFHFKRMLLCIYFTSSYIGQQGRKKAESFSFWVSEDDTSFWGWQNAAQIMLLHAWKACGLLSFTFIEMIPWINFII